MQRPLANNVADRGAGRQPRRGRACVAALAAVAVAMTVAACGGGSAPGVANLGKSHGTSSTGSSSSSNGGGSAASGRASTSTSSGGRGGIQVALSVGSHKAGLKFSHCMRANGEPNFPDPNSQGAFSFGSGQGIDPRSTQFQAVMQKCRKDLPTPHFTPAQLAAEKATALRFSQCMRSHGVTNYPDPQFGSGGRVSLRVGGPGSGLDPSSPVFQRAQRACGGPKGPKGLGPVSAKQ